MGVGPLLAENCQGIRKLMREDWDYPVLIPGPERVGKSALAICMALEIDPQFTPEQIVFDIPRLYSLAYSLPKYRAIIVDEGATSFFSRDAMKTENREGIKLITTMGHRNLFVIICTTTIAIVDDYIRRYRVKAVVRVTSRGRYRFYGPRKTRQIRYDTKIKRWVYPSANFAESYTLPEPDIWEAYQKRKNEYLTLRADIYKRTDPELIGISDACKLIDRSSATIYKWEKAGILKPNIVSGRKKYRIGDLKKIITEMGNKLNITKQ